MNKLFAVIIALTVSTSAISTSAISTSASAHEGHRHPPMKLDLPAAGKAASGPRQWLAGDHHIHSEFSADYQPDPQNPAALPTPLFGRDGRYPIRKNAEMARQFGLDWMVSTDHGGPGHARINHDVAYPALLESRAAVPEVLQFFGMEFDTPAGDHSSLIIPRSDGERSQLREIESNWSQREAWPADPARDQPDRMIGALQAMRAQPLPPVLFANHPSRSATSPTQYGRYDPAEFRNWNDTAPNVAVGMEGAPGHQAGALKPDGSIDPAGRRGGYAKLPTMGGFDPMTARLGGLWDTLLGEGRRWWITATSDSHRNWREDGNDFWPGEYAKTYVQARKDPADIVDGLRHGRIFVTTGDLVSAVDVSVKGSRRKQAAGIGGTLRVAPGEAITIEIRVADPQGLNHGGRNPQVNRIDLITGAITPARAGPNTGTSTTGASTTGADRNADRNPTTRVERRFTSADWTRDGDMLTMRHTITNLRAPLYLRIRGTNTDEAEPAEDPAGEDPWSDLWFYANPVFVELTGAAR